LTSSEEKEAVKTQKFELLYPQDLIARRIKELGNQISRDYANKELVLIGVLKGCIIFLADLVRHIKLPVELEFISASSYNGNSAPDADVVMMGGPKSSLAGRHVLLVEGVVDSGHTVLELTKHLKLLEPASIEVVTLLDKPGSRKDQTKIKYVGFKTENHFVIGFGLDAAQKYRNLPFIGKVVD
jgi:hypoxanthine phosphoribosyltransferase